jgi:hypothetical protein
VASDQPILQYPPASLGTLVNPSTLNTYLSCLDRRESPDHKCNRAVLLSGCRQTVVNEAPMVISGLVDDLRFTCKSLEKESAPEGTRTPGLRHARAARALLARTILSKNSAHLRGFWQPWHALFSVLFGSILARLLHLCCTVNAKLAKGEWESLRNSLMPE